MSPQSDLTECLRVVVNLALLSLDADDPEWYNVHRVMEYLKHLDETGAQIDD